MANARITNPKAPASYPQKQVANRLGFGENKPFGQWSMTMGEFQVKYEAYLAKKATKVEVIDNRKAVANKPEYANFLAVVRQEFGSFKREIKSYIRQEVSKQITAQK